MYHYIVGTVGIVGLKRIRDQSSDVEKSTRLYGGVVLVISGSA